MNRDPRRRPRPYRPDEFLIFGGEGAGARDVPAQTPEEMLAAMCAAFGRKPPPPEELAARRTAAGGVGCG